MKLADDMRLRKNNILLSRYEMYLKKYENRELNFFYSPSYSHHFNCRLRQLVYTDMCQCRCRSTVEKTTYRRKRDGYFIVNMLCKKGISW